MAYGTTLNSSQVLTDDNQPWPEDQPPPSSSYANVGPQPQQSPYYLVNLAKSLWSGATLPGDVATGNASMTDPATQQRVGDMALLATGAMGNSNFGPVTAKGFNVYHGSPNTNIDQFSSSAIGSGEGTQMEGHGLYFSESPSYAKGYAQPSGALYHATIDANPEHFINWNAPMEQQSWPAYRALRETGALPAASGQEAYNNLLTRMSPSEASSALQAQGVPGIRQPMFRSSRSNYVLFDDTLAKIRSRTPLP